MNLLKEYKNLLYSNEVKKFKIFLKSLDQKQLIKCITVYHYESLIKFVFYILKDNKNYPFNGYDIYNLFLSKIKFYIHKFINDLEESKSFVGYLKLILKNLAFNEIRFYNAKKRVHNSNYVCLESLVYTEDKNSLDALNSAIYKHDLKQALCRLNKKEQNFLSNYLNQNQSYLKKMSTYKFNFFKKSIFNKIFNHFN